MTSAPPISNVWLLVTLITPVYAAIGRHLIESVRDPSVVRNPAALEAFRIRPMGITRAIERALTNEDHELAETRWSDARARSGSGAPSAPARDLLKNEQTIRVPVGPAQAFAPIRHLVAGPAGTSAMCCGGCAD